MRIDDYYIGYSFDGSGGFPPPFQNFAKRYRVRINSAKIGSSLTNYLLYLNLADMPASFWANLVYSDGRDIQAALSDATTRLPLYVASINTTLQTGYAWVRISGTVSSIVDTDIYVYAGSSSATMPAVTDTYGRNNVFQDYRAFYGFEEDPSGTAPQLVDWTGNGNDGTANGAMTSSDLVPGKIGNAWDFDGVDDYADCGAPSYMSDTQGAAGIWVKVNSVLSSDGAISMFCIGDGSVITVYPLLSITKRRHSSIGTNTYFDIGTRIRNDSGSISGNSATSIPLIAGGTYHVEIVSNGTTYYMYVNGVVSTITNWAGTPNGNWVGDLGIISPKSTVGAAYTNATVSSYTDDDLSQLYIRSTAPSADRISAEYENQNSPSTFYTIIEA